MSKDWRVRWTEAQPYILEIDGEKRSSARGPFALQIAAAYAAKVVRGHSERNQRLSLAIFNKGAMVVEATVDSYGKCEVAIANGDIYDASPLAHRAEIDMLCAACYNAAQT